MSDLAKSMSEVEPAALIARARDFRGQPIYRRVSFRRPISSYSRLRKLYGALVRGRAFQVARLDLNAKKYLNAGCGPNSRPEFINLDYDWLPGIELCWDLTERLPFNDSSLNGVYCEHCLEHFSYDHCQLILTEFRRVLTPGGFLRVVVPDVELYFDLYQQHKGGQAVAFPYAPTPLPEGFTPLMAINPIFFSHGHQYAYDAATLGGALHKAGFKDISKERFMQGRHDTLLIDSPDRAVESLYMEACS